MSELEKAQAKTAEEEQGRLAAEQRVQNLTVERAVYRHASKAGITDPAMAARLVDPTKLEFDDNGDPKDDSITKALDDLTKVHPILKGGRPSGSGDGGVRGSAPSGSDFNQMIREKAGKL
jgi:hypothetical protein